MSRLKAVFPDDWEYILNIYGEFIQSTGCKANDKVLLMLLDVGVRFGERLAQLHPRGFVEIGCGMGIPSLTLAKLGCMNGRAMDIDSKILSFGERLREHLGCDLQIQCSDVFEDRPELEKGEILIAEKPASYKKNVLEVEYNIRNWCVIKGHNLAVIPSYMETDTPDSYSERCAMHEKKLKQVGFKVENEIICEPLPYRWLIATKSI